MNLRPGRGLLARTYKLCASSSTPYFLSRKKWKFLVPRRQEAVMPAVQFTEPFARQHATDLIALNTGRPEFSKKKTTRSGRTRVLVQNYRRGDPVKIPEVGSTRRSGTTP